jgi:putative aminophosphonate oxidoreductase
MNHQRNKSAEPQIHHSYWFKQAMRQEAEPIKAPLTTDINTDVLIVGGGYTGLWTAIMLKQQAPEKTITIIEKGLCGSGASGANGGCLLTWSTKYPTLQKLFGEEQASWLVAQSEQVIFEIEAFCKEFNIDAQLMVNGTYYTATNPAQQASLDPVMEHLQKKRIGSWQGCKRAILAKKTGSEKNISGYYSAAAGTVQPALLVRGLYRVAQQLGVKIYENTEMQRINYGQPATVQTTQATITAKQIVLAINAWMAEKFTAFKRSIVVVSSDMVISKPQPELLKKHGPAPGVSVVDSRIFVHYYRDTCDGRIMLGKGGNRFSFANRIATMFNQKSRYVSLLTASFTHLFPYLKATDIADNWTSGSDRSVTGLPFFGSLKDQKNIYYGLGYSGNGVAQSRLGGKILSSMVLGLDNPWTQSGLCAGPLGYFPPEPFRWLGAMLVRNAVRRKEIAEDACLPVQWVDKNLAKLAAAAGKADKI